jgi:hypothetical protein
MSHQIPILGSKWCRRHKNEALSLTLRSPDAKRSRSLHEHVRKLMGRRIQGEPTENRLIKTDGHPGNFILRLDAGLRLLAGKLPRMPAAQGPMSRLIFVQECVAVTSASSCQRELAPLERTLLATKHLTRSPFGSLNTWSSLRAVPLIRIKLYVRLEPVIYRVELQRLPLIERRFVAVYSRNAAC